MTTKAAFLVLGLALLTHPPVSSASPTDHVAIETRTLIWPDGTRYVGGVKDGKRSGKGTIFWEDGTRFVGTFENDQRNGPGTMILPDGTVYTGHFRNDELVQTPLEPGAAETGDMASTPAGRGTTPENSSTPLPAPKSPAPRPVTEMNLALEQSLKAMVDLWAAAWSEQNVVQYLAYYSGDFDVPGDQSRAAWEAMRRSRLTRPDWIKVGIEYRDFNIVQPDVVDVSFRQAYESDVYSDVTLKTLRLGKEGPYWRILAEETR